jgi:hypothetical protein
MTDKKTALSASKFRAELIKIMPSYDWTVHKSSSPESSLTATGTQSSGFNRLSTLEVKCQVMQAGERQYVAQSAGFGKNAQWLHKACCATLAQTLRTLQDHYESQASLYKGHAEALKAGRLAVNP